MCGEAKSFGRNWIDCTWLLPGYFASGSPSGNDKRAEVLRKVLDLGFGVFFLFVRLFRYFR
jgi:hypothetical protein